MKFIKLTNTVSIGGDVRKLPSVQDVI